MVTSLKRTGVNCYSAMLAVKNEPANWGKPALLLHFVEQSQASAVFIATDGARDQFLACEHSRIYHFEVPGKCVRRSSIEQKCGVKTTLRLS